METIKLTQSGNCQIRIHQLPQELIKYIENNYNTLMDCEKYNPSTGVLVYDKDTKEHSLKKIFRQYKSFMKTPQFDSSVDKSYMFHGKPVKSYMFSDTENDADINRDLPNTFEEMYEYVQDSLGKKYNQAVINWYNSGSSYIEMHSDCTAKMVDNPSIVVVNLNNPNSKTNRIFSIKAKAECKDALFETLNINLSQGLIIEMVGDTQLYFRHGVNKCADEESSRISLTLRQMNEERI